MLTSFQKFLGIILFVGILAGCQSLTGQPTGEYIDDAAITAEVKTHLANNQVSSLPRVEVETIDGKVHLTGVVKSEADKTEATRVVRQVKGVKQVDNDLVVRP